MFVFDKSIKLSICLRKRCPLYVSKFVRACHAVLPAEKGCILMFSEMFRRVFLRQQFAHQGSTVSSKTFFLLLRWRAFLDTNAIKLHAKLCAIRLCNAVLRQPGLH